MSEPGSQRPGSPRVARRISRRPRTGKTSAIVRTACLGALVVGVLGIGAGAAADVPPPAGYVERCTIEAYEGADCVACDEYRGQDRCAEHAEAGRERCCRSYGGNYWREVWCAGECPALEDPARESDAPLGLQPALPGDPTAGSAPDEEPPSPAAEAATVPTPRVRTPASASEAVERTAGCGCRVVARDETGPAPLLGLLLLLVWRRRRRPG